MTTLNLPLTHDVVTSALARTNQMHPTLGKRKSAELYKQHFPRIPSDGGVRKLIGTKSVSAIIVLSRAS